MHSVIMIEFTVWMFAGGFDWYWLCEVWFLSDPVSVFNHCALSATSCQTISTETFCRFYSHYFAQFSARLLWKNNYDIIHCAAFDKTFNDTVSYIMSAPFSFKGEVKAFTSTSEGPQTSNIFITLLCPTSTVTGSCYVCCKLLFQLRPSTDDDITLWIQ